MEVALDLQRKAWCVLQTPSALHRPGTPPAHCCRLVPCTWRVLAQHKVSLSHLWLTGTRLACVLPVTMAMAMTRMRRVLISWQLYNHSVRVAFIAAL